MNDFLNADGTLNPGLSSPDNIHLSPVGIRHVMENA